MEKDDESPAARAVVNFSTSDAVVPLAAGIL